MIFAGDVQIRRADPGDAEAIASAHLDSIRSIGPAFYALDLVEIWSSSLTPDNAGNSLRIAARQRGLTRFAAEGGWCDYERPGLTPQDVGRKGTNNWEIGAVMSTWLEKVLPAPR